MLPELVSATTPSVIADCGVKPVDSTIARSVGGRLRVTCGVPLDCPMLAGLCAVTVTVIAIDKFPDTRIDPENQFPTQAL